MRIGICEDNSSEAEELLEIINRWINTSHVEAIISVFDSAENFLIRKTDYSYDILFLDIQMGEMNGMQLARLIRETDEQVVIIFLTALREYVIDGYDVNALHYLVKPVDENACIKVLNKAKATIDARKNGFFLLGKGDQQILFNTNDVYYIQSSNHNIAVNTRSGNYYFRETINAIEKIVPPSLCRCHRMTIVNIQYIKAINKTSVLLSDPQKSTLMISSSYWAPLNKAFLNYYGK